MKELDLACLPIWQDQGDQEYPMTWEVGSRKTLQGLARFTQVTVMSNTL